MASGARPGSLVPPRVNGTAFPGLGPSTPDGPYVESCTHLDTHYDIKVAVVFAVYIIFGILYTFLGKSSCYSFYNSICHIKSFIISRYIERNLPILYLMSELTKYTTEKLKNTSCLGNAFFSFIVSCDSCR